MMKGKRRKVKGSSKTVMFAFSLFAFYFLLSPPSSVSAQDDDDVAPPPLKLLAKDDRTRLEAEPEIKLKTKLAVEMMVAHIDAAEKLNSAGGFDGVFRELGFFRALMDYTLEFLAKQDLKENRSLDNYKRFELGLRAATPRIESIRREMPLQYEEYVRKLLVHIRDARSKASEPLFSDTVLPTEKQK